MEEVKFIKSIPVGSITKPLSLSEQEQFADKLLKEVNKKIIEDKEKQFDYNLPDHLEKFRQAYENADKTQIKLPTIISQLTPRTKKKLSMMPPPSRLEKQQLKKIEKMASSLESGHVYKHLEKSDEIVQLEKGDLDVEEFSQNIQTNLKIPRNTPVDTSTTKFYEEIGLYVKRKAEQDKKIASLFLSSTDALKAASNRKTFQNSTNILPKLPAVSYSRTSELSKLIGMNSAPATAAPSPALIPPLRLTSSAGSQMGVAEPSATFAASSSGSSNSLLSSASEKVLPTNKLNPLTSGNLAASAAQSTRPAAAVTSAAPKKTSSRSPPPVTEEAQPLLAPSSSAAASVVTKPAAPPPKAFTAAQQSLKTLYTPLIQETEIRSKEAYEKYARNREEAVLDVLQHKLRGSEKDYLNQFSVEVYEEIGLDINKEYIRLRKFKKYIQLLLFFVRTMRLKAAMAHYKEQIRKVRSARLKKAAQRVFRAIKAANYWKAYKEKQEMRRLQNLSQEEADRLQQLLHKKMATRIQRMIYRYAKLRITRRALVIRRQTVLIQKRMRGVLGRRKARAVRLMHQFIYHKATIVNSAARRRLATRKMNLVRKLDYVKRYLEHVQATKLANREAMYTSGAEVYIAQAYRTYMIRKKLKNLVYWNHVAKAMMLQRCFRGYKTRKVTRRMLKETRAMTRLRNVSALKIQMLARRYIAKIIRHRKHKNRKMMRKSLHQEKLLRLATVNPAMSTPWAVVGRAFKSLLPFKHIKRNKMAVRIQKVWRGHHGRHRMFVIRVNHTIELINDKIVRSNSAALVIQRRYRGWILRQHLRRHKRLGMIVRIQCIWRFFRAANRVRKLKKLHTNASQLTKYVMRYTVKHRFHVRYKRYMSLMKYTKKIQCFARKFLARRRLQRVKTQLRSKSEMEEFLTCRENDLLSTVQLRVMMDTLSRPMGHRYAHQALSGEECPCYGPMQAVFILAVCAKGKPDPLLLATNKVDSNQVSRFLNRVYDLMVDGVESSKALKAMRRKKTTATLNRTLLKNTNHLAMLDQLDRGHWHIPAAKTKISGPEMEILLQKCITDRSAGVVLNYPDFLEFLYKLASVHYAERNISLAAAMLLMGEADDEVYGVGSNTQTLTASEADSPPEPHLQQQAQSHESHHAPGAAHHWLNPRKRFTLHQLRYDPAQVLEGPNADLRMALILKMFVTFRDEAWMQPILSWLDSESKARVGVFVTRMQGMVRKKLARTVYGEKLRQKKERDRLLWMARFAVRIQAAMRRCLHRAKAARVAQKLIIQYIPYLGEPYWFNPRMDLKTWSKPKVLRNLNCYSIALPEQGLENLVQCCYCSKSADVNCVQCEESMCKNCFNSMHCKGNRQFHHSVRIPMCKFCKFQVATKTCLTCILIVPTIDSIKYGLGQSDRGTYCDCCFAHEHDLNEKILDKNAVRKKGIQITMKYSHEAYLVKQQMNQKVITNHKYDQLTQVCEECRSRSSAWRCLDCQQVYCNQCLVGLHSMGGAFSRHNAEMLPYYTQEMHTSIQRDLNAQALQFKMEKLARQSAHEREELRFLSVIRIQSWWRMICQGYEGRKHMVKGRRMKRIAWRARRKETQEVRNTLGYKLSDVFSCAPALRTDTHEEAALRKVNIFFRERAREYIWKNRDDWGFYRVSSSDPRKGIPKTGFNVGTPEELMQQALYGGDRLPGKVLMRPNELEFETTCNWMKLLKPGQRIRIQKRLFGVIRVEENSIKLNRQWRGEEGEEAEVAYKVPIYSNEEGRYYFRAKYAMYSLTIGNPVGQVYFYLHKAFCLRMVRYSIYMLKMSKKSKNYEDAEEWRQSAEYYSKAAKWASGYLSSNDAMVDLTGVDAPDDEPEEYNDRKTKRIRKKGSYDSADEDDEGEDGWGEDRPMSGSRRKPGSRGSRKKRRSRRKSRVHADGEESGEYEAVDGEDDGEGEDYSGGDGDSYSEGEEEEGDDFYNAGEELEDGTRVGTAGSRSKRGVGRGSVSAGSRRSGKGGDLTVKYRPKSKDSSRPGSRPTSPGDGLGSKPTTPTNASGGSAKIAKKKTKKVTKDSGRPPGVQWYATLEETQERNERESKMTPQELALEAGEWKECIDVMTENVYWVNIHTNELMTNMPRALAAKKQLEFENSKNKKNYDEAQRRIQRFEMVTRNRLLITGGRKK